MTTPRKILKIFSIIHFGMLMGPLAAGIIFYFTTDLASNNELNQRDIFIYIFPILGLVGIFVGKFLFTKFMTHMRTKPNLREKLGGYQTASLMQYALVEGPALLNIIWFSQTGNLLYLTIGGVLLIYLFTLRPKKSKVESDLELKGEHKRLFDKLDDPL